MKKTAGGTRATMKHGGAEAAAGEVMAAARDSAAGRDSADRLDSRGWDPGSGIRG